MVALFFRVIGEMQVTKTLFPVNNSTGEKMTAKSKGDAIILKCEMIKKNGCIAEFSLVFSKYF